jgi:hypothetical protein
MFLEFIVLHPAPLQSRIVSDLGTVLLPTTSG